MNVLLVEPIFPTKTRSKNHKDFLPIGLLKLSSYYKRKKYKIELVQGKTIPKKFKIPSNIEITTLFTYWSEYVWECVDFYRKLFPDPKKTKIRVGGIYASLRFDEPDFREKCEKYNVIPFRGIHSHAESHIPDYRKVMGNGNNIDYQIVHSSRGCFRKCPFCGTWKIEPKFQPRKSIRKVIESGLKLGLRNIVFYDNNFLHNPHIRTILNELIELKRKKEILWCESQSGFDGRLLSKDPELAVLLKKAGFRNVRIAWDWGYEKWPNVEKQLQILKDGGFNFKDIYVFMIYNWKFGFNEMEKKRVKCYEWGVQIANCRYRPLDQLYDNYRPYRDQSNGKDYFISSKWTDYEVKQFRKNVRRHNICIRQKFRFHSSLLEHKKKFTKEEIRNFKTLPIQEAKKYLPDLWIPSESTLPTSKRRWPLNKRKIRFIQKIHDKISPPPVNLAPV